MANVVHHRTNPVEVPARVYWVAGIGLLLVALLFALTTTTASNPTAPAALMEPSLPFVPFIPVL